MSLPIFRPLQTTSRIPELLESIKTEFESLAHELNHNKMQNQDLERKLNAQYNELSSIQTAIFDLDRAHNAIKKQYEEENLRLKRQLELQGAASYHQNGSEPERNLSNDKAALPGNSNGPSNFGSLAPLEGKRPFSSGSSSSNTTKRHRPDSTSNESSFYPSQPLPPLNPGLSEGAPSKLPNSSNPASGSNIASSSHLNKLDKPENSNFLPLTSPFPKNNNESGRTSPLAPSRGGNSSILPSLPPQNNTMHSILESHIKENTSGKANQEFKKHSQESVPIENSSEPDWVVGYHPTVQPNLNVELSHTHEHHSVVCCVKFSQDGKWLATGCNRSAQIFDVETGDQIYAFNENTKDEDLYIRSVCFSPDSKFLATGAEDKTVKVWNIEHKSICHTFYGHDLDIYSLDYSPNGNIIVSGSGDKKAKIWDLETQKCLLTLGNEDVGPKDGVTSVAISPDGRFVAAGSLDRVVRLWEVSTGFFIDRYEGHSDSVYSVAFSPDGKSLASGSLDRTLKLWDLSSNRPRARSTFTGHKDFVLSVAFSPDGNWLVSGSKDRSVQFWDPRTSIAYMMLQGHKNSVISVAMNPVSGTFATGSGDYRSRVWKYKPTFCP